MGERKVLNKYYPPTFDPSTIPRRKQPKNQQMKVRMMLPMSIRCSTCGNYIYKGTKFNSRMEDSIEDYLGLKIFRFYFKCTNCSAEITYLTDPKNSDYTVESGATRNFEPWRAQEEVLEKGKRKREEEEMGEPMKSLENRTLDSKQEMNILAGLEEIKDRKSRQATVSVDAMFGVLQREREEMDRRLNEEEEALVRASFKGRAEADVKRTNDDDIDEDEDVGAVDRMHSSLLKRSKLDGGRSSNPTDLVTKVDVLEQGLSGKQKTCETLRPGEMRTSLAKIAVHKKPKSESGRKKAEERESNLTGSRLSKEEETKPKESVALQSLSQQYESDDD